MAFQDLIEKETREKLAKIDEYQKLISVREELMDLTAEYKNVFDCHGAFDVRKYLNEHCGGFWGYKEAREFLGYYDKERTMLTEKMSKSLFHKKRYAKEIEELDKRAEFAKKAVAIEDKHDAFDADYEKNQIAQKIREIEKKTIKQVLTENRNNEEVEDAFFFSIKRDGESNLGRYETGLVALAYEVIDEEVKRMLMKTKYREKIDDLKTQLRDDDFADEKE